MEPTQPSKEYDYLCKILIVGDTSVGKSCLLYRYCDETFSEEFLSTVGVDFKYKHIKLKNLKTSHGPVDELKVKLQIWDTAGQERFKSITASYYRGAASVILAFDVTDPATFSKVQKWLKDVRHFSGEDVDIVLVGTKCDMIYHRVVDKEVATKLAKDNNLKYMETSAKDGTGVNELFQYIAETASPKFLEAKMELEEKQKQNLIDLEKKKNGENFKCCTIL